MLIHLKIQMLNFLIQKLLLETGIGFQGILDLSTSSSSRRSDCWYEVGLIENTLSLSWIYNCMIIKLY